MKRKQFLFGLLFIAAIQRVSAQEKIAINVMYEFRYVRDLTQKDNPYISSMILSLGKGTSHYCSEKEYKENDKNTIAKKKQQQLEQAPASSVKTVYGGPGLRVCKSGVAIREEVLKDLPARKMETIGFIGTRTYIVETPAPAINWTLKQEKKTIDKYTCQKAIGQYAGRVYEAWFAPDLPYPDGPWKLNGLPGLILEARDTTGEVVFTFKGITRNDDANATIVPFLKDQFSITTNLKSYNRSRAAFDSDPEAIILAAHPDARIFITCIDGSGTKNVMKIKKYNPIEKD